MRARQYDELEADWYRQQGEHDTRVYEYLDAGHDELADWKVTVLLYSALHRVNHWFITQTGRVSDSHALRYRRVRHELAHAYEDCRDYAMSVRARYCEGFRIKDRRFKTAVGLSGRLEKKIPFTAGR